MDDHTLYEIGPSIEWPGNEIYAFSSHDGYLYGFPLEGKSILKVDMSVFDSLHKSIQEQLPWPVLKHVAEANIKSSTNRDNDSGLVSFMLEAKVWGLESLTSVYELLRMKSKVLKHYAGDTTSTTDIDTTKPSPLACVESNNFITCVDDIEEAIETSILDRIADMIRSAQEQGSLTAGIGENENVDSAALTSTINSDTQPHPSNEKSRAVEDDVTTTSECVPKRTTIVDLPSRDSQLLTSTQAGGNESTDGRSPKRARKSAPVQSHASSSQNSSTRSGTRKGASSAMIETRATGKASPGNDTREIDRKRSIKNCLASLRKLSSNKTISDEYRLMMEHDIMKRGYNEEGTTRTFIEYVHEMLFPEAEDDFAYHAQQYTKTL